MPQDTGELVVASAGDVYTAPVGTALPTTATASLNAAFYSVGLITEEGVTWTGAPEVQEFRAWQRQQAVRRERVSSSMQAAFSMEQWNAENITLAFGGGTVAETSAGQFRYDAPADSDALDERSMVIDWNDGDRNFRLVFPRGNVAEAVEAQLVRNQLAVLPITFQVLSPTSGAPWSLYINDSAFHS